MWSYGEDCDRVSRYIVATAKDWNLRAFERRHPLLPGRWQLVTTPSALEDLLELGFAPRYIFFPHWSWKVSARIFETYECVCFHCTDLPYGRGGSPVQNLIVRGHLATQLTALRMVEDLDAGPIYLKKPVSLQGSAQEIFERMSEVVYDLIEIILESQPVPVEQEGEVVRFPRRHPSQSVLPEKGPLSKLYDHIRMLDADSYPAAHLDFGSFRLTFRKAKLVEANRLEARVEIVEHG